ncbi:MAG: Mrp/NBP35 family ATP-binding protein [Bacillota bacterium]|nr:Mrp/NBP35 family ATP-binding protein [Bacillota bacterium]
MEKREVLQALAGLKVGELDPLAEGFVQDVLIEPHADGDHVAVLVDDLWRGERPPEAALEAIRRRLEGRPGIAGVRVVPRSRGLAERSQALARSRSRPRPRVPEGAGLLAVASGKGGVGKSTVSVNLAVALARRGVRTALLDCDIYGFSVPSLIGLDEPPRVRDGKIVPPSAHGVQVVSMDFFVRQNDPVIWRGPMLGTALRQLMGDTLWESPRLMILDLPPGTGDVALDVHEYFPDAAELVVTTPDPLAARVAERAGSMALRTGHRLLGVVENLAYMSCEGCGRRSHPFGRGGGDAVAAALGTEVLARIPFDPSKEGRGDGLFAAGSPAGRAYAELAERVAAAMEVDGEGQASPPATAPGTARTF